MIKLYMYTMEGKQPEMKTPNMYVQVQCSVEKEEIQNRWSQAAFSQSLIVMPEGNKNLYLSFFSPITKKEKNRKKNKKHITK